LGEVYIGEFNFESWNSSADIATGYGLDGWGSIFGRVKRFFCSPKRSVPSEALSAPIQWITGALPRGYSGQGVKLITYLHLVSRSRMMELYLHSPISLHAVALNYKIKHRANFTFISRM
jgi:hypothetical protein